MLNESQKTKVRARNRQVRGAEYEYVPSPYANDAISKAFDLLFAEVAKTGELNKHP